MKRVLGVFVLALALLVTACRGEEPTPTPVLTPVSAATGPAATAIPSPTQPPPADTGEVTSLQGVKSATIRIQADGSYYSPDGNDYRRVSSGSGFIIDPEGIAVTNNHVVGGAAILQVWVGGESQSRNARILGVSECADLAVIDIEGGGYPYLNWFEGEISPGLAVYAAGYPHGDPEYALTQGIVTKAEADGESTWSSVDSVLQHQAPIAPACSGSPLVTDEGQVVGVNYAAEDTDVLEFFAITGPEALPIIEGLRADEDVDSIGINPQAVAFEDGVNGIWVTSVQTGSPADQAGLMPGDMITGMAGMSFLTDETLDAYSMADYCDLLRTHGPDATLDIRVARRNTGEILDGQVNGRPLEPVFSFADAGEEDVVETDETYSDHVKLQDDTGAIELEVPAAWQDVDGSPMLEDDGTPYAASIIAAPNLEAFNSHQAPGVRFAAMAGAPGQYTAEKALEVFDFSGECEYVGRKPYSDSLYEGAYDHYTNCGGNDVVLYVVASLPEEETHLNLVIVKAMTDADLEAADRVLATFQVVGDLPGAGQGTDAEPPSGETIEIGVVNDTPEPVCEIYLLSSDSEGWGENRLESDQLEPGYYWAQDVDASGDYDLTAVDCSKATLGVLWRIGEDAALTLGGSERTVSLLFENSTTAQICVVYISPSTADDWGENWLGQPDTYVDPNQAWRFWLEPGTYDLLARDCEGEDVEQFDEVDLTENRTWTLGDEQGRSQDGEFIITVYNESPSNICSVQIAPTESDEWGENRVAENSVYSGEWREFAVEVGGTYDLIAKDCRDAYLGALWEVEEAEMLTIGGPERTLYLVVENNLEVDVCEILIAPAGGDDWGEDWLQEEGAVITSGTAWAFWLKAGRYDFLARDCEGEDLEWAADTDLSENTRWNIGD